MSFFSGTGFSWPGSGSGFGTSTILTGGFSSASRFAALNGMLSSRIGISGTLTRVAQAATASTSTSWFEYAEEMSNHAHFYLDDYSEDIDWTACEVEKS